MRSLFVFAMFNCLVPGGPIPHCRAFPPTGEITGFVSGPNGSGLPGTMITILETPTGTAYTVVTGSRGIYRASGLPDGDYEMRTELQGFEPFRKSGIRLSAGETRTVDIRLEIATIREIVTVVETAPRDSLEGAEARESSARDVGEALARTMGVAKLRKGGIANDVVLRGFQSKDLNVLVDGQRIYGACPNHMDPPAFHVDFDEVDRVEVGKGPFDMKNQGSLGGVLNVITRKPGRGLHASANLSGGSYVFLNPSATASYGGKRVSLLGGYSYRLSEPYTDGSGKRFTEYGNYRPGDMSSDAFRVGTAWGRLSFAPASNHLAQLSYTHQQADHVLYPYLLMDAVYDDTDRVNLGYSLENLSGVVKAINVQVYHTQVRHWMTDEFRTSSLNTPRPYSMGTSAKSRATGGRIEAGFKDLTLGVEAFSRGWDASTQMAGMGYLTQYSIPDVTMNSAGLYAGYRWIVSDRLQVFLNGRVDGTQSSADSLKANTNLYYAYNSSRSTATTDINASGSAHATYSTPIGLEFGAGLGRTVRNPDPAERYFALQRAGYDWVGNPALVPSRNTGLDGSVSFRRQGLLISSNIYYYRVDDYVTVREAMKVNLQPGIMNTEARSYTNVDARLAGSEFQAVYTVGRRVFLSGSLQQVRGRQNSRPDLNVYSGNLAEMPPMTGRAGIRFDTGRVWAEVEGIAAGAQHRVDTDLREDATAGYGIGNLRAGVNVRRIALRVGLNNVFNRKFHEHLSYQRDPFRSGVRVLEPGRNLYVNLSYRY
jgi:iron complex outermembrane receptor protein